MHLRRWDKHRGETNTIRFLLKGDCILSNVFHPRDVVGAVFATATWLGGWLGGWRWLDVTRRYCIKTAKLY